MRYTLILWIYAGKHLHLPPWGKYFLKCGQEKKNNKSSVESAVKNPKNIAFKRRRGEKKRRRSFHTFLNNVCKI